MKYFICWRSPTGQTGRGPEAFPESIAQSFVDAFNGRHHIEGWEHWLEAE